MFSVGQQVMIIGDNRCNIGAVVTVAGTSPCDMGDKRIVTLYRVLPLQELDGEEMYFQEHLLLPLNDVEEPAHLAAYQCPS